MWPRNLMNDLKKKKNKAPLLYYIKLCASFQIHWWIQCSIRVTLKFDGWPWKMIGYLFYTTLSFVLHFKATGIFKLELQSGNAQFGPKLAFFVPGDFENWRMTYYVKLCASFQIHWWSQTWVTVRKRLIWVKIDNFFSRVTLKFDGWPWRTTGYLF